MALDSFIRLPAWPTAWGATEFRSVARRSASGLRLAMLVLAMLCVAAPAQSMSIREFRALQKSDKKQGEHYARYYLVGVMEGILEAQAIGVRSGARPTICIAGRRLEPRMAQELFETELKRNDGVYEADMPVPLVLAQAMAAVYPC